MMYSKKRHLKHLHLACKKIAYAKTKIKLILMDVSGNGRAEQEWGRENTPNGIVRYFAQWTQIFYV